MSFRSKCFAVLSLAVLVLGPALSLPRLSAHSPTFTAPPTHQSPAPLGSPIAPLSPLVGMGIKVKDAATAAKKFKERASGASTEYATNAAASAQDWEAKTSAAEEVYKQSVIDAANKGRFGAGVRGSAEKFRKNVTNLGGQRYASGIGNAQDTYAQAMGPVLATIAGLTLPPRGVKGTNQERSNAVAVALRKAKVGG